MSTFLFNSCSKNFYAFIPTKEGRKYYFNVKAQCRNPFIHQPEWSALQVLCFLFKKRKTQPTLIAQLAAPKSVNNWLGLFTQLARRISYIDRCL